MQKLKKAKYDMTDLSFLALAKAATISAERAYIGPCACRKYSFPIKWPELSNLQLL